MTNTRNIISAPKIIVYVDDREKAGKVWPVQKYFSTVERKRLETGDYIFQSQKRNGIAITVEKKGSWKELILNLTKRDRTRFEASLIRLAEQEKPLFIIEESIDSLPHAFYCMPREVGLTMKSVLFWLNKIMFEYDIPVIMVGSVKQSREAMLEHLFDSIRRRLS